MADQGRPEGAPGDTPVALAYLDLLRAKERLEWKDTPAHRRQLEEARVAMDELLDALPLGNPSLVSFNTPPLATPLLPSTPPQGNPSTPTGPGASSPGPVVSPPSLEDELLSYDEEGEGDAKGA